MAFLVWAWLTNLALLVGVEVNREVELRRAGGSDAAGPSDVREMDQDGVRETDPGGVRASGQGDD